MGTMSVVRVYDFLEDHPSVLPAVLALAALAWFTSARTARRIGCRRSWAALLVFACAAPAAMTLLPHEVDLDLYPTRTCVMAVRPPHEWVRGAEELANLLLLAPAGFLLASLLRRGRAAPALLLAAVSPVLVETLQYAVPTLRRLCETTDVLLNLSGLLLGAATGLLLRSAVGREAETRVGGPGVPPA